MFLKKFFKLISVALLCSNALKTMDNQDQQCEIKQLQQAALHCCIREFHKHIALNLLKDNPSITGSQLATMLQGILSHNMIRHIHRAIWEIRNPTIDTMWQAPLLASKAYEETLEELSRKFNLHNMSNLPGFFLHATHDKATAIHNLQFVCQLVGTPLRMASIAEHQHNSIGECTSAKKLFETTLGSTQATSNTHCNSWLIKYLPQSIANLFSSTATQPFKTILCFNDLEELSDTSNREDGRLRDSFVYCIDSLNTFNPNMIVLGLTNNMKHLDPAIVRRGDRLEAPLTDELKPVIVKMLFPSTRFDLTATMQELIDRANDFTLGQLTHIMDEAYLEAAFENLDIQREHIIGAYNRARRQLQAQIHNQQCHL